MIYHAEVVFVFGCKLQKPYDTVAIKLKSCQMPNALYIIHYHIHILEYSSTQEVVEGIVDLIVYSPGGTGMVCMNQFTTILFNLLLSWIITTGVGVLAKMIT